MAEGAADWEGPAPPDAAGGEDDPRAGPDGAPGDGGAVAPAGRWRDRRSGVVLPGTAGAPADSEAGLLEAARATPRRSSIIKVSEAGPAAGAGAGVGGGCGWAVGGRRMLGVVFSRPLHLQTFLPRPEVRSLRSRPEKQK